MRVDELLVGEEERAMNWIGSSERRITPAQTGLLLDVGVGVGVGVTETHTDTHTTRVMQGGRAEQLGGPGFRSSQAAAAAFGGSV